MGTLTRSKRQLAWVFDLNKCIGCQTCSVACKVLWPGEDPGTESMWWMTVNTQPGRGMPRDWQSMGGGYADGRLQIGREPTEEEIGGGLDFNYDEVLKGGRGRDVHLHAISGNSSWGMNWDEDEGGGQYPNSYFFYLPRLCAHCTRPACVEACPHDAIFKREDDGLVLIDEARCQGDRSCIRACPYKKISFNPERDISQKCIGCFPRIDHGVAPVCVRSCPGRAAFVGFLDDERSPVHQARAPVERGAAAASRVWRGIQRLLCTAAGAGAVARRRWPGRYRRAHSASLPGVAVRSSRSYGARDPEGAARKTAARRIVGTAGHPHSVPLEGRPRPPPPRSSRHRLEERTHERKSPMSHARKTQR